MKVVIEEMQPGEWEVFQDIALTVFDANKEFDPDLNMSWPTSKEGEEYYKSTSSANDNCRLLAKVDGRTVGYLIGGKFSYPYRKVTYGEIQDMGVLPEFRRQGIGSALVDEFRKRCKSKGYYKLYVNAYFDDPKAVNFYKKQGMIPSDLVLIGKV